jgi:AraC family transcriptional regulator
VSRFHGFIRSEESLGQLSFALVDYGFASVLAAHDHPRPYVSFLLDGSYTEVSAGVPKLCNPGAVIVHEPAETHADIFHQPARLMNVEFDWPCPPETVAELIRPRLQSIGVPLEISDLLFESLRTYGTGRPISNSAPRLDYAIANFDWLSTLRLTEAARLAGLHPTHFTRAFQRHTGFSPSAYRMRERVCAASKLLLGSTEALASVALKCGFNDQSHFTNAFRLMTGLPPARYRGVFCR